MKRRIGLVCLSSAAALAIALTSGCSKNAFKPGQKLSGRYNTIVQSKIGSYLFKEDSTFEHTGFGKDGDDSESGTYAIDGKNITFNVGAKNTTVKISTAGGDADKLSPRRLYIGVETYELSASGLTKADPNAGSRRARVFDRLVPPQIGSFRRKKEPFVSNGSMSVFDPGKAYLKKSKAADYPKVDMSGGADYLLPNGDEIYLSVERYKSPEDAKLMLALHLAQDTDYSNSAEPETDVLRFKISRRISIKDGEDLIVMDSMPRYDKSERVYWVKGNHFYRWDDSAKLKDSSMVEALARAYVQQ